ncbi:hypothetical protein CWI85_22925 [Streptomyces albidoflavus]|nr:hypothetical protein CWI85_22925 [Streptomyces albidoflavus]
MAAKDSDGGQQKANRPAETTEEQTEDATVSEELKERQEALSDDVAPGWARRRRRRL